MCRNIFISFITMTVLFFSCPSSVRAEDAAVIPVTVGDVEKFKSFTFTEKKDFIFDFYKKNKENGVTDGQILNELLKLDSEEVIAKAVTYLGEKYREIELFVTNMVKEINLNILEKNPGRTDLLISIDDVSSWKNIQHMNLGKINLREQFAFFKEKTFFSNSVSTEGFSAVLASCMDKGTGSVPMSFILFPRKDYVILTQREQEAFSGVNVDFSGSENLEISPLSYPLEKVLTVNDRQNFGYDDVVYLPFSVTPVEKGSVGKIKAVISADVCKDGVCQTQTTEPLLYETKQDSWETLVCSRIMLKAASIPSAQKSGFKLEKAFFKEEINKEINLFVLLKRPVFGTEEPDIIIKNRQGLLFSRPFINSDGNSLLIKFRLLNPEAFQKSADLVIDIADKGNASEFSVSAKTEKTDVISNPFFSFSILDFIVSFLAGIKFIIFTPLLSAFLFLGYQAAIVETKSPEKTVSFYNGLGNMFYFWFVVYLVIWGVCPYVLPDSVSFWGAQFLSPAMNFVFLAVFLSAIICIPKVFDDKSVRAIYERFPAFFSFFKPENIRETAGLTVGFVTGFLLLITPMTDIYYNTYLLLSRSVVLYTFAFVSGISLPFIILSLCEQSAAAVETSERAQQIFKNFIAVPLYIQAVLFVVVIKMQTNLTVLIVLAVLVFSALFYLKKNKSVKAIKTVFFVLILTGAAVTHFLSNKDNAQVWNGEEFNETLLYDSIREGKAVYLSVSENFCLSCYWNRFIMNLRGAPQEIRDQKLIVMRINYNNPFLKRLFGQSKKYGMPVNIIFSPTYPEGKIVFSLFNLWTARDVVVEGFTKRESEPDPQTAPEQSQPNPAEKGTD